MLSNADKPSKLLSESLNFHERIRALRSDLDTIGPHSRTLLPNIQRLSNGLQSSLKHKIRELQSKEPVQVDPASANVLTEFAEVQTMIERTKERFRKDDARGQPQDKKVGLLVKVFRNPDNEDPVTLGQGKWLQNYFDMQSSAWEVNDLAMRINDNERKNRSTMITFLRESDSILNQASMFLGNTDLSTLHLSSAGSAEDRSFQAKQNSQTLVSIRNYITSKHKMLPAVLHSARSMKDGYFPLNQSGSRMHSFMSQAASQKNDELVTRETTLTPEQRTVEFYLTPEKLRPNFQHLLERMKIDEPRGCEPIYDIIMRMTFRLNQEPRASEWSLSEFLVHGVNSLILESCLYIQTAFWTYVQTSHPIMPCPQLPNAVAENFGRLLNFVHSHLTRFSDTLYTKDLDGIPVWGVLYFAIRSGLFDDVFVFCKSYTGSLEEEVRAFGVTFVTHLRSLRVHFGKDKEEKVQEFLNANRQLKGGRSGTNYSDDFKAGLSELFERRETLLKETLAPRVLDAIWFRLFSSFESYEVPFSFRIFGLQTLIRTTNWTAQPDMTKNVAFYHLLSLMFDECPIVLRDLQKDPSDALKIAFLVTESRLSAVMRVYSRLADKEPTAKPASKYVQDFAMGISRTYWGNGVALLACLPSPAERHEALLHYSKTHNLFQLVFDFEIPQNKSPNDLKALVQPSEFKQFVVDSLKNFQLRDDWKNATFLSNALLEIDGWRELCGLFINLKYEQIKRMLNSDQMEAADFERVRVHIEKTFRDFIPAEFKTDVYHRAAAACEDIKVIFFDVVVRKAPDQFHKLTAESFRHYSPAIALPSYFLIHLHYINLALRMCLAKIRTCRNKGETKAVLDVAERFETFQNKMPDENAIKNETKKTEIVRLKQDNIKRAMEIKGSIQRY